VSNEAACQTNAAGGSVATLASGSGDKTIKLWDVATGKELATLKTHHMSWVWCVAYSPDGKTLASGDWNLTIILWLVQAAKQADK
jgi:WD40 repeat protein